MSEEPKKKKGLSKGAKWGIGCLGLIVIIILIVAFSGGPSKNDKDTDNAKTVYTVGETINLKNHQLIVNSVDKNFKSSNQFDTPQNSENVFVTVNVTIVNNGSSDLSVNSFGFTLEDESGTQRNTTIIAGLDNDLGTVTVSPNGKVTGNLGFEAKANSATLKLHYSPGAFGGDEVTINL